MCDALRRSTHKDAEWAWGHEQEVAFERIKEAVVKAPVLKYFNESDPTECQGDASQGGFVLMRCGQPATFARRALNPIRLKKDTRGSRKNSWHTFSA